MKTSLVRRGAIGAVVTALAATGMTTTARAVVDPYRDAGTVIGWSSDDPSGADSLPDALGDAPLDQAAAGSGFTLTRDVDGTISCFGDGGGFFDQACTIPADVTQQGSSSVAAGLYGLAGAVLEDGSVQVWGTARTDLGYLPSDPWPTDVPAALRAPGAASSLAIGFNTAAAVTTDGRTIAWGIGSDGTTEVPADLQAAGSTQHVSLGWYHAVALKTDGSVAAWGSSSDGATDVPVGLTSPGAAQQALATPYGGVALTSAGRVVTWGGAPQAPTSLDDTDVRLIGSGWGSVVAVTDDDVVEWGGTGADVPAVDPDDVVSVSSGETHTVAVVRALREVAAPSVAGTPSVGQTLTGTSGTFTGGGTVTQQWFAGDAPIVGATGSTLAVTGDLVGKEVSLRSTATKGDSTVSSTSTPTSVVVDPPAAITGAAVTVSRTPTTTSGGTARLTFSAGARPVNGVATITLTRGTTVRRVTTTITQGSGAATLPSLSPAGRWQLVASVEASGTTLAGTTPTYSIAVKATVRKATLSVVKKPTSSRAGKVRVSFQATGATVDGTAKVRLTRGTSARTVTVKVRNGKGTATLPTLTKGTWRLRATLGGTSTVGGKSTGTVKLRVKK